MNHRDYVLGEIRDFYIRNEDMDVGEFEGLIDVALHGGHPKYPGLVVPPWPVKIVNCRSRDDRDLACWLYPMGAAILGALVTILMILLPGGLR